MKTNKRTEALPTIQDIWEAQTPVYRFARKTPCVPSRTLSNLTGNTVYLKQENLQIGGSFKIRGAANRIAHLTYSERKRGVIATSAGNHGQGTAIAAKAADIPCVIVVPREASKTKIEAMRSYGATVIQHGADYEEAALKAHELQAERGLTYIQGFDDNDIIAGQGTLGLEILHDVPDVDIIVASVGGGGLISGVSIAAKTLQKDIQIIGVQATGAASMIAAYQHGSPVRLDTVDTIADGIAIPLVGQKTYRITTSLVDELVTVTDREVSDAIMLLLDRCKLLVEGAGAASVAALLSEQFVAKGKRVVAVLSGGNLAIETLCQLVSCAEPRTQKVFKKDKASKNHQRIP